eukprot:3059625-Prymnesium_polylepis.1
MAWPAVGHEHGRSRPGVPSCFAGAFRCASVGSAIRVGKRSREGARAAGRSGRMRGCACSMKSWKQATWE